MTDRQYAIFSFIRSEETVYWAKILNTFKEGNSYQEIEAILKNGLKTGYVERTCVLESPPLCKLKLTDEGSFVLMAEDEQRIAQLLSREEDVRREHQQKQQELDRIAADKSERNAEKRADHVFQILLTLLSAFLSFILGLATEHFTGLLDLITSFF